PGGMIDVALPPTELFGNRVIAEFAAPGFPSRRVSLSGGQLSGQHFDVYMSPAAITGNVTTSTGVDAGGTDLFVQVERDGVLQPYAIPGGFDYSPPWPPTGVPHGTLAAPGGAYYFPIRTEDLPAKFEVTANAQRNLAGFLSASG